MTERSTLCYTIYPLSWLLKLCSKFWNQQVWLFHPCLLFLKDCFDYSGFLAFPYQFYVQCINFCKNQLKLHRDWIRPVDPFGEYFHLNILRFIITSVFVTPLSLVQNCYPLVTWWSKWPSHLAHIQTAEKQERKKKKKELISLLLRLRFAEAVHSTSVHFSLAKIPWFLVAREAEKSHLLIIMVALSRILLLSKIELLRKKSY